MTLNGGSCFAQAPIVASFLKEKIIASQPIPNAENLAIPRRRRPWAVKPVALEHLGGTKMTQPGYFGLFVLLPSSLDRESDVAAC